MLRYHELIEYLKSNIYRLSDVYTHAKANEEIDKCQNLCRLFTELGETLLEMICNIPGEGTFYIGVLLWDFKILN